MDSQLLAICMLTMIIHLIGSLAFAARIAGVRTGRIAISFALFNILVLVSRISNSFLAPFLAKRVETGLSGVRDFDLLTDMRLIIAAATAATIIGSLLIPTVQRLFSVAIVDFQHHRSIAALAKSGFRRNGLRTIARSIAWPSPANFARLRVPAALSMRVILLNVAAQALLTVGVLASLYAGFLTPDFRVTASQLSAIVNGLATIFLFLIIDPQLSVLTDDVVTGRVNHPDFRRVIVWLAGSRIAGTLLAQLLLLPAAIAIARVSNLV